ncbi:E3 ubiquitin-protein ligase TRIM21-like [Pempheris klunzingeri]|uniref:E3 ubiquitin-protein ligase TRIM21-like n=1 Tax=Pempheris klunzingeri TaxID=3127111 RepID=UPI00397ED706
MAANTSNPSRTLTEATLTKKQAKAIAKTTVSSSAPWNKPSLSEIKDVQGLSNSCVLPSSSSAKKPDLKEMQTFTECLQLLHKLAEEVNNISQVKCGSKKEKQEVSSNKAGSLETSRSLILHWAKELEISKVNRETKSKDEKRSSSDDGGKTEKTDLEKQNEKLQQWAVELKNLKEANGMCDEELKRMLYPSGPKESRMAAILPLLEFVAWSLLSEDTEEDVSMLWLPTKQKAWRTGTGISKYIPNSVWQWIRSASVSVRLDVSTSSSWLVVSSDRLQVQEAPACPTALSNSQRLDEWPCVLGDTIITAGRHYWEVEVSPNSSWRIGVMLVSAPRKQKMSPRRGHWTLWKGTSLWACTDTPTKLQKLAMPKLIGVYVDVGEGQVSFYDVDQRAHIYTFCDTFKHSLIPVFGYLDGNTVLRIIPADVSVTADDKNM